MTKQPRSEKAKIVLLSGFLGSGKTTLLQRILSWPTDLNDTVVIINEFGDAGIDGSLLKESGSDIVELSSGCICCTLSGDFLQSLRTIWSRFHPRRILIEATGVADPVIIAKVINESEEIYRNMELLKVITILDADYWEPREMFGPLFYSQLKNANLILLNKVDEHEKEKIPVFLAEIHELFPNTRVIPTIRCRIDEETIWTPEAGNAGNLDEIFLTPSRHNHDHDHNHNHDHNHDHDHDHSNSADNYVSFSFCREQNLDEVCFQRFLANLPWEVFRVKGPVRFPDRTVMLNFVGGKSEFIPWKEGTETRLVFIGWEVIPETILEQLEPCLITS